MGIEEEDARESPLLSYSPTLLDDLIRGEVEESDDEGEDLFDYDDEDIPVTLKALFADNFRFNSVLKRHAQGKDKRIAKRARTMEKEAEK